eukprot:scaffold125292_cov51-Phaeocystis_antarctica.AAC.1
MECYGAVLDNRKSTDPHLPTVVEISKAQTSYFTDDDLKAVACRGVRCVPRFVYNPLSTTVI